MRLAFYWYLKAADQGNSTAQYRVGTCYENGEGANEDFRLAIQYYEKAANQGNGIAQCNLGRLYFYGYGVEKNYELALFWYKKAASERDNLDAYYRLGYMYLNGIGVPIDYKKAFENFKCAADQGDPLASDVEEFKNGELVVALLSQEWPDSDSFINENCRMCMKELVFISQEMQLPIPKELVYIICKLLIKLWPREQAHLPYT